MVKLVVQYAKGNFGDNKGWDGSFGQNSFSILNTEMQGKHNGSKNKYSAWVYDEEWYEPNVSHLTNFRLEILYE